MKKRIAKGLLTIISLVICATLFIPKVSYATRMFGIEQIVKEIKEDSNRKFRILEIVPDYSLSSFGYYVKGSEPELDGATLTNWDLSSRKEQASQMIESLGLTTGFDYKESFYKIEGWGSLNRNGSEWVTGIFREKLEGEEGQYSYIPTLYTDINIVAIERGGNNINIENYKPQNNDIVTFEVKIVNDKAGTTVPANISASLPVETNSQGWTGEWIGSATVEGGKSFTDYSFKYIVNNEAELYVQAESSGRYYYSNVYKFIPEKEETTYIDNPTSVIQNLDVSYNVAQNGEDFECQLTVESDQDVSVAIIDENNAVKATADLTGSVPQTVSFAVPSGTVISVEGWTGSLTIDTEATGTTVFTRDVTLNNPTPVVSTIPGELVIEAHDQIKYAVDFELDRNGNYVFVKDDSGESVEIKYDNIYFKTFKESTSLFEKLVLELEDEYLGNTEVYSYTPIDLNEALILGEINLNDYDMIYISNSGITPTSDPANYYHDMGEGVINDVSWSTAYNLFTFSLSEKPVIYENSIINSDENLSKLGLLLQYQSLYGIDYTNGDSSEDFWTDETFDSLVASVASYTTGTYGSVKGNVWLTNGSIVTKDLGNVILDYTTGSDKGNSLVANMEEVLNEISTDNFYNSMNGIGFTVEYSNNSSEERIQVSLATIMKHIINYSNRRILLQKDTIKVLDIEPTKYSNLTPEIIKKWLNTTGDSKIEDISITLMTTNEFIGKLEDLVETYDLIYIGSCIGPEGIEGSMYRDYNGETVYNDSSMNGLIYSHVGDTVYAKGYMKGLMNSDREANGKINTSTAFVARFSGNDITQSKMNDLIDYAKAGYPVVFDERLVNSDGSVNTNRVDNSSYLYTFMNTVLGQGGYERSITKDEYDEAVNTYGSEEAAKVKGYYKNTITVPAQPETNVSVDVIGNKITNGTLNGTYAVAGGSSTNKTNWLKYEGTTVDYYDNLETTVIGDTTYQLVTDDMKWRITSSTMRSFNASSSGNLNMDWDWRTGNYSVYLGSSQNSKNYFSEGNLVISNSYSDYLSFNKGVTAQYVEDESTKWHLYEIEHIDITVPGEEEKTVTTYKWVDPDVKILNNIVVGSVVNPQPSTKLALYINMPRLSFIMYDYPTEYSYTTTSNGLIDEINFLDSDADGHYYLRYTFEFANTAENYNANIPYQVRLYVDVNADGQYSENEELDNLTIRDSEGYIVDFNNLKSETRYTVTRQLPDDYVGLVPWKLTISLVVPSTIHSSVIGYTAVQGKGVDVKVLQIKPVGFTTGPDLEKQLTERSGVFYDCIANIREKMNYNIKVESLTTQSIVTLYNNGKANGTYQNSAEFFEKELNKYNMIILGFSDCYDDIESKEVAEALLMFIDSGKSVLFSHDTTSYINGTREDTGITSSSVYDYWGYHLNTYIRDIVGMDRFGIVNEHLSSLKSLDGLVDATPELVELITANGKDVAYAPNTNKTKIAANALYGFNIDTLAWNATTALDGDRVSSGSNRIKSVTQVNKGQITTYPYTIDVDEKFYYDGTNYSDSMERVYSKDSSGNYKHASGDYTYWYNPNSNTTWTTYRGYIVETHIQKTVSATHSQYYQLDMNMDKDNNGTSDIVVWYAMSDGRFGNIQNDVRNNYYIYSVGNVVYTGMGHFDNYTPGSLVQYDEAMLFINTIVSSYEAGIKNPSFELTEYNTKASIDDVYRTFDDGYALDQENEVISMYVNDINVIQGEKTIYVDYYEEITNDEYENAKYTYNGVEGAAEAGYYETIDDGGSPLWLKRIDDYDSVLERYPTIEYNGTTISGIKNNEIQSIEIKGSWIADQLESGKSGRFWVGVYVKLDYASARKDEITDVVFDYITFKKRVLFDLD